ncbi:MAG: metal-dependent hydrolase [Pseudomonadota bacterium]
MTSRTHDAFAFATLVTVAAFYPPQNMSVMTLIFAIIAADIGALIPDMDTAGNRLWELLPQGQKVGKVLRHIFFKHRTITHSIIGVFAIYKFLEWLLPKITNEAFVDSNVILASVMIGIFSHLLSDSLTEEGVPLLFPLRIAFGIPPIRKIRIKTGQWFENLVVFPGVWLYLLWFVSTHQLPLLAILRSLRS